MIGQVISHYRITEKLGEGGMGVVYKAEDTKLDRSVALKFLPPGSTMNSEAKARFIREARAASALEHPNVCTIYEISETDDDQLFIAMAYYEGETLKEKIDQGPLPIAESIDIAMQIAQGLAKAHERGIVHRDIKPANVMITPDKQAVLMDFGLATSATAPKLTRTGMAMGTAAYMSPEQVRGERTDHKTDIWSWGVVVYEMIAGQLPFPDSHEAALVYSITNTDPRPLSDVVAGVSLAIDGVVDKALAKDPKKRYQKLTDVLVDMDVLKSEHVSLSQPNILPLLQFRSRKVKRAVRFGIAALGALLLITIGARLFVLNSESEILDSLAVLPLENLTDSTEQDLYADGMTQELTASLSKISRLQRVISGQTMKQYRNTDKEIARIAQELNVKVVVTGTIRRIGQEVSITVQLVQAKTDQVLWADSFAGNTSDALAIQNEIARSIAAEIDIELSPTEELRFASSPSVDPEAMDYYMKGMGQIYGHWGKEPFQEGIQYFLKAVEISPGFARAYQGLASGYWRLGWHFGSPGEYQSVAWAAIKKARQLDPGLADIYWVSGMMKLTFDFDWEGAEKDLLKAIELDPNSAMARYWYGSYLTYLRDFESAFPEMERSVELDPLGALAPTTLGWFHFMEGRYDQAIEKLRRAQNLFPGDPLVELVLTWNYAMKGVHLEEAMAIVDRLTGGDLKIISDMEAGWVYARAGKPEITRDLIEKTKPFAEWAYVVAKYYASLNDAENTFLWLEKTYETQPEKLIHLNIIPLYEFIRSNVRYQDLLRRINYPGS